MPTKQSAAVALTLSCVLSLVALSQDPNQRSFRNGRGGIEGRQRGGMSAPSSNREDYPMWQIEPRFEKDVFTFVRIQYDSMGMRGRGQSWQNDFPDCDWNFSYRLQQLTSFRVDPYGKVLRFSDPQIFDFPFLFMTNPGQMILSEDEVASLRRYLTQGGFLMGDDFWAPASWRHIRDQMKIVLPDCEPTELTLDHEIFHNVYDLAKLPQVPSILAWRQGDKFEYWHGDPQGDEAPHFWAYRDRQGRIMALFCHNNDIADGWEREGEDKEYFDEYSLKVSYPFGINLITYVMTH